MQWAKSNIIIPFIVSGHLLTESYSKCPIKTKQWEAKKFKRATELVRILFVTASNAFHSLWSIVRIKILFKGALNKS